MFIPLRAALVGGDARQRYLSELLTRDGHTVTEFALCADRPDLSTLQDFPCVILPMPITRDGVHLFAPFCTHPLPLTEVLDALTPEQKLFGGGVTPSLSASAEARNITLQDYMAREELAVANAVPTAEGAVQLAMENLPITLHQSRVLIVGFGRVGQCTALRFAALGARVTVAARSRAQQALAESMGLHALSPAHLRSASSPWDLVINTVPAVLLDHEALSGMGNPILLELASAPGGFDPNAVQKLGLRLIPAPGLPGKVAPLTAARIIRDTLYAMLEDSGA